MANKLFGLADPQYDALRVSSNQALDLIGNAVIGDGSGVLNMIYLWPADKSSLSVYEPTQAGLSAAIAAAVSGDTICLPSVPIALTAGITIPAGVALVSMGNNSILNFSGFDGAALTLSAGSIAHRPVINFVATGASATGILAQAADAVVIDPVVNVSGATVTNIAIGLGASQSAGEIWILLRNIGVGYKLLWSTTFGFEDAVNDTAWNVLDTFPVGFDSPTDQRWFAMNPDGSDFYLASDVKIWRCTNAPDVRAAPATVPTYEIVADSSTDIDGYNILTIRAVEWWNDRLCVMVRTTRTGYYYGEYFGSVWTWTYQGIDGTAYLPITYRAACSVTGGALDTMRVYNPVTLAVYFDLNCGFGAGTVNELWRNYNPDTFNLFTVWTKDGVTAKIVDSTGSVLHDTGLVTKIAADVTGAILGSAVFVIMEDGELFVSEDGSTFTAGATWQAGTALDAYEGGGGSVVWIRQTAAEDDEVVHISLDRGVTTSDKTGDLWTVIGGSALGIVVYGRQLIFD